LKRHQVRPLDLGLLIPVEGKGKEGRLRLVERDSVKGERVALEEEKGLRSRGGGKGQAEATSRVSSWKEMKAHDFGTIPKRESDAVGGGESRVTILASVYCHLQRQLLIIPMQKEKKKKRKSPTFRISPGQGECGRMKLLLRAGVVRNQRNDLPLSCEEKSALSRRASCWR